MRDEDTMTDLPDHLTCARAACSKPKTAAGEWQYCSPDCLRIGRAARDRLPALDSWTWLPLKPREVRASERPEGEGDVQSSDE